MPAGLPAGALEIPVSKAEPELDSYEPPAAAGNGKFHFPGADWLRGVAGLFRWKGVQKNDVSDATRMENERRSVEVMALRPLSTGEQAMMARIFPSLEIPHFEQRTVGDCYLLAYLHALAKKPYGRHVLSRLIREEGDHWVVRFADLPEDIPVYPQDLSARYLPDKKHGGMMWKELSRGDIGFRILEVAFGRRRNRKDPGNRADTFYRVESGFQWEVSGAIMGDMASSYYNYSFQREACLATFSAFEGNAVAVTLNAKTIPNEPSNPPRWFRNNHVYDVVAVNSQAQTITISNPHGSESLVTTISYDEFFRYFTFLEMEQVNPTKVKAAFGNGAQRYEIGGFRYRLTPHVPYLYDLTAAGAINLNVTSWLSVSVWVEGSGEVVIRLPESLGSYLYRLPVSDIPYEFGRKHFGDDPTVSDRHFQLTNLGGGRIVVTDLSSTNGVTIHKWMPPPYRGWLYPSQEYAYDLSRMPGWRIGLWLSEYFRIDCAMGSDGNIYVLDEHGRSYRVMANGTNTVIGRRDAGGLGYVSEEHVQLTYRDGNLIVRDLGSGYGTYVGF